MWPLMTGTGFNGDVTSLAPDGSGNLYVGGNFTSYNGTAVNRVVRLTATGTVDGTFATGSGTGFNDAVFSLAPAVGAGTCMWEATSPATTGRRR